MHTQNFRFENIFMWYRPRAKLKSYKVLLTENFGNEKGKLWYLAQLMHVLNNVWVRYMENNAMNSKEILVNSTQLISCFVYMSMY